MPKPKRFNRGRFAKALTAIALGSAIFGLSRVNLKRISRAKGQNIVENVPTNRGNKVALEVFKDRASRQQTEANAVAQSEANIRKQAESYARTQHRINRSLIKMLKKANEDRRRSIINISKELRFDRYVNDIVKKLAKKGIDVYSKGGKLYFRYYTKDGKIKDLEIKKGDVVFIHGNRLNVSRKGLLEEELVPPFFGDDYLLTEDNSSIALSVVYDPIRKTFLPSNSIYGVHYEYSFETYEKLSEYISKRTGLPFYFYRSGNYIYVFVGNKPYKVALKKDKAVEIYFSGNGIMYFDNIPVAAFVSEGAMGPMRPMVISFFPYDFAFNE